MIDPADRVVELVQEFIEEHEITSEDVVYQSQGVLEAAPEFFIALCEAVGYAESEDDAEDDEDDYNGFED